MSESEEKQYARYCKKVWILYSLLVVVLIVVLVTLVASDTEERFFYTVMPAAAAYVFRPTDRFIGKVVLRLFGVEPPAASSEE
jgi:type IV secretory pathway component VirB8